MCSDSKHCFPQMSQECRDSRLGAPDSLRLRLYRYPRWAFLLAGTAKLSEPVSRCLEQVNDLSLVLIKHADGIPQEPGELDR